MSAWHIRQDYSSLDSVYWILDKVKPFLADAYKMEA